MPGREKQTLASTNQMRVHIASSTCAYNPVLISRASRFEIRRDATAVMQFAWAINPFPSDSVSHQAAAQILGAIWLISGGRLPALH